MLLLLDLVEGIQSIKSICADFDLVTVHTVWFSVVKGGRA